MKKGIMIFTIGLTLLVSSCSVNTSGKINIDTSDITYVKDERSSLCFGLIASRKTLHTDATGLGITCVPCEKVEHLIED